MAERDFDWYVTTITQLMERDRERDKMFQGMDRMVHLEYSLPESLQELEWIRRFVSTKPYDAVRAGVRVLSGLDERVRVDPVSVLKATGGLPHNMAAKKKANEWETAMKWQMDLAARRKAIVREDVVRSAIMYDEVVGQIIHLPTQIRAIEKLGGNPRRQKAAKAYGDYVLSIKNPQSVHTRYSEYMPEAVAYVRIMEPQEIVDFWGGAAKELQSMIDRDEAEELYMLCDYVDHDRRYVFAAGGADIDSAEWMEKLVFMDEPWTKDFLPWICVLGGSNLESAPEHQRFPLMYGVYQAEQWITSNLLGSLVISEPIAEMGRPDVKVIGPDPETGVDYEFGQPGGEYRVRPGHDVVDMEQRGLDPALREAFDRFENAVAETTIPRVLVTAEAMPGEPFSGYNLRVQQAIAALRPYKQLSERWFSEAYRQMLVLAKEGGAEIRGYGKKGEDYSIAPEDIDPDNLYIRVELTPDVPLDRQQRINSAVVMAQQLKYPATKILEELGETNPEGAIREWQMEQLQMAYLQGMLQRIQMETSGELQMLAQQMAQQQAMAMQQGQPSQQPNPNTPPGMEGVGGMGWNPAAGGLPPAMANPAGNVREQQTGRTRLGEGIVRG